MKKNIIIIIATLFISASLLIGYNFEYKKQKNNDIKEGEKVEAITEKKMERLYTISDRKVKGFFINKESERMQYYSEEGNIWEIDFDGRNERVISNKPIPSIEDIAWSPDGKKAILKFGGKYFMNDTFSGETTVLPDGIDKAIWSEDGKKIIYKFFDSKTGQKSIRIADLNGENQTELSGTDLRNVEIEALRGAGKIAFWNSPRAESETILKIISLYGGEENSLFSSKKGADYKWSPNGKKAIVSFLKEEGSFLSTGVINIDGSYIELGIPTIASKTAWSLDNKTCFFAISSFPEGSKLPDDYEDGKIVTVDTFWKIDTESGEKSRLIELEELKDNFDASGIKVAPNGRSLFFINRVDGLLYRLDF